MVARESGSVLVCLAESAYLVRVVARGTVRESAAVRDFVCRALDEGVRIVLDLSDCEYLDSTFQGCLVMMQRHDTSSPGSLQVYADDMARQRIFGVSQLDVLLSFASVCPRCLSPPIKLPTVALGRRELCEHLIASHNKLAELGGPSADAFRRIARRLTQDLANLPT